MRWSGSNDYCIKRSIFLPAKIPVTDLCLNVVVILAEKILLRFCRKFLNDFDCVNLSCNLCKYCRLVSGACSYLKNPVSLPDSEEFGHSCDNVWLGDCLALSDGQGIVAVCSVGVAGRNESVALNLLHCSEDRFVLYPPDADLSFDHLASKMSIVGLALCIRANAGHSDYTCQDNSHHSHCAFAPHLKFIISFMILPHIGAATLPP